MKMPDDVRVMECVENGEFTFDILAQDGTLEVETSIYSHPETYVNESTAKRHAEQWLAKYRRASDAKRRELCGFDPVQSCCQPDRRAHGPVLKRRS